MNTHSDRRPIKLLLSCWICVVCSRGLASAPAAQPEARQGRQATKLLFDGKSLDGWKVLEKNDFKNHGDVSVRAGAIVLERGRPATGISYQGTFPRANYEVSLEAKRIEGRDFFCGMTFPIRSQYCTLILGGWGGGVTGLSNIDDQSAVENETTNYVDFQPDRWYRIRLRVSDSEIEAWVDEQSILSVDPADCKFAIWWEQEPVRPFGIATWYTTGAIRKLRVRSLDP